MFNSHETEQKKVLGVNFVFIPLADRDHNIGMVAGNCIYLAEKRDNDVWVVFYLRETEPAYKEGIDSIDDIGITPYIDSAWTEIQKAHEKKCDLYYLDDGEEPADDPYECNRKYFLTGDTIRKYFHRQNDVKVHIADF